MKKILITGATGNIGKYILKHIRVGIGIEVYAGVRNLEKNIQKENINNIYFDFDEIGRSADSLNEIDCLFLLRPPQLSDVKKYFEPLVEACLEKNVQHIVFLSVQGAEKSSIIPHNKIEKLISSSGISYTFLRPGYFMQNLTGPLKKEIKENDRILIPAGQAKFNWIDADDIGMAGARVLESFDNHTDKIYTLTGTRNLSFKEAAKQMSEVLGRNIKYESPNLVKFFVKKKKEGLKPAFILVMIMLHFLPRFENEPEITFELQLLTGEEPKKLQEFIFEHKNEWNNAQ